MYDLTPAPMERNLHQDWKTISAVSAEKAVSQALPMSSVFTKDQFLSLPTPGKATGTPSKSSLSNAVVIKKDHLPQRTGPVLSLRACICPPRYSGITKSFRGISLAAHLGTEVNRAATIHTSCRSDCLLLKVIFYPMKSVLSNSNSQLYGSNGL